MSYEFVDHTADIKCNIQAPSLNGIFQTVVLAMASYISKEKKIRSIQKKRIVLHARDVKALMYRFIEEILFLLDSEGFIASKATVRIRDTTLQAELQGDHVSRYPDLNHIKAVTYADMHITQRSQRTWEACVVLDV